MCAQSVSKQLRTMSAPALESISNPSAAARIGPRGIEMAKFKMASFHTGILWSRHSHLIILECIPDIFKSPPPS